MKLNKENIRFIDNYLIKKGVKYLDVRVELLDHLSTEFEGNSNYVLLIDFLNSKEAFISEFQKKRYSKLHWCYQKQLWQEFFKGFYTVKGLLQTILVFLILLSGLQFFEIKTVSGACLISAGIINFSAMLTHFRKRKAINKLQSSVLVFGILSLPVLPLYLYGQIDGFIESYTAVFVAFWMLVLLLNLAGATLVYNLKIKILEYYHTLILA
ncbi:hypothetical protein [uncultured Winogradskyella sp.]|uniref:hypothetical protein n=1 Tax=uncultured Winogradskyella sp. TaxID=395353 RepID=UPI0030DC1D6E|tara:strand:- start:125534 stop:126166 length:633 start_codon:yes stop_codon:yes gene_type:complete